MRRWWPLCAAILGCTALKAQALCTAAEVAWRETNCPNSGVCVIRGSHTIGDGCVLDFGDRTVVLDTGARLVVGSGSVRVVAGSIVLRTGSLVDARGVGSAYPANRGGSIRLQTTGGVIVEGGTTRARVDASGNAAAGTVAIEAGGPVQISGRLLASHLTASASGGQIRIYSGQKIVVAGGAEVAATGGSSSPLGGGTIVLEADGDIQVLSELLVNGSSGGTVSVVAGGVANVSSVRGNGTGVEGGGGEVRIAGFRGVALVGPVRVQGSDASPTAGGDGGSVSIEAAYGDVTVDGTILAEGAPPEGLGGEITASAAGDVLMRQTVSARAAGAGGTGGTIEIAAGGNLGVAALLDASGGSDGGAVTLAATSGVRLTGTVDARGRAAGGAGGEIEVRAGDPGDGPIASAAVAVLTTIDASGGGCGVDGCGVGGTVTLTGCNLVIETTGRVLSRGGGTGGWVSMVARKQIRVDGTVNCQRSVTSGTDGTITLVFPSGVAPQLRVGGVLPPPTLEARVNCASTRDVDCLLPCPQCGDGQRNFPEECDDGNLAGCDGCSPVCVVEDCDPLSQCVGCDPRLSCPPSPDPPCPEETPATATPSSLPSASPTPTASAAPTASATATSTPTVTTTPTRTPTRSFTPTATFTRTRTPSPTATQTPTATATPRTRYDVVVLPVRPVTVRLREGMPSSQVVRVRVRHAQTGAPAVPVQATVSAHDCAPKAVVRDIDFEPATPGNQNRIELAGGRSAEAGIELQVAAGEVVGTGRDSPFRCRVLLRADVDSQGNEDPTPFNNSVIAEVNILDLEDPWVEQPHQSVVLSAKPQTIRLRPGVDETFAELRVAVRNADRADVEGHAITLVAADGDCPTGTIAGPPVFHRPNVFPVDKVMVPNRAARRARVPVRVARGSVAGASHRAPYRCTLLFEARGPAGDRDWSNNTTALVLDVYPD